jgi:hypothetical protein
MGDRELRFRVAAVQLSPVPFDRDGTTEKVGDPLCPLSEGHGGQIHDQADRCRDQTSCLGVRRMCDQCNGIVDG